LAGIGMAMSDALFLLLGGLLGVRRWCAR
jgi:hypothetical protein